MHAFGWHWDRRTEFWSQTASAFHVARLKSEAGSLSPHLPKQNTEYHLEAKRKKSPINLPEAHFFQLWICVVISDGTIYHIVSNIAILRSYHGISLSWWLPLQQNRYSAQLYQELTGISGGGGKATLRNTASSSGRVATGSGTRSFSGGRLAVGGVVHIA